MFDWSYKSDVRYKEVTAVFIFKTDELKFLATYFDKPKLEKIFFNGSYYTIKPWELLDYNLLDTEHRLTLTLIEAK